MPHLFGKKHRRRDLLACLPLAAAAASAQIPEAAPQMKPELVKEFVSKSHSVLETVREIAAKEPMIVRAAWDQGAGDWETGLGAASHMGRRDIAKFLIDSGARIDVFAIFMLGELASAKAAITAFPMIHKTSGPHGISLLSHAIVGKKDSWPVFELLLSAGADVNAAAWRGITPLMQAVLSGEIDMARALLDKGADVAAKAEGLTGPTKGFTALDFAKRNNSAAFTDLLSKV